MDTETVNRLRAVISKLARQLNGSSTGEGLTPSQASVLGLVVGRGPLSLSELAEIEGLNPTMVSRVVGALDMLGLIRRTPDPADLRSASVSATPAGCRRNRRVKAQRAAVVSQCLSQLEPEQVDALLNALPSLEALAAQLRESARPLTA